MPTLITSGDASNGAVITSSNDNALTIQTGAAGAKVNAIALASDGTPTFAKGFEVSKATNGYQKLPSGLIIQWGSLTTSAGGSSVTFPISFPTGPASISVSLAQAYNGTVAASSFSASGFTANVYTATTGAGVGAAITWIAIGY